MGIFGPKTAKPDFPGGSPFITVVGGTNFAGAGIGAAGQAGGFASVKREEGSEVRGIAWLIPNNEIKNNLDKAEGVNMTPSVYRKETMKIHILGTDQFNVEALVYISNKVEFQTLGRGDFHLPSILD